MDQNIYFLEAKERALNMMDKAKSKKKVDKGIEQILYLINKSYKF